MNTWKTTGGKWLTKALFFETSLTDDTRHHAIYTLKQEDHEVNGETYISLYKLYMACKDPTEYEFATTYLGGWSHWLMMQKSPDLMKHINIWKEEYIVRSRSVGVKGMFAQADEGSYQACKYLADEGWVKEKKGRPTTAQITKEAKAKANVLSMVKNDKRLLGGK